MLSFTPTVEDDGKLLTCRSENPFIPESSIEDKWRLVVHCECYLDSWLTNRTFKTILIILIAVAPVTKMNLGPTLDPNGIKEGDDVYFECHIQANPKPYKMVWLHNVRLSFPSQILFDLQFHFVFLVTPQGLELRHNISILSDESLVLQSVKKDSAGDYTCQSTNAEGSSSSNTVTLRIRCEDLDFNRGLM